MKNGDIIKIKNPKVYFRKNAEWITTFKELFAVTPFFQSFKDSCRAFSSASLEGSSNCLRYIMIILIEVNKSFKVAIDIYGTQTAIGDNKIFYKQCLTNFNNFRLRILIGRPTANRNGFLREGIGNFINKILHPMFLKLFN